MATQVEMPKMGYDMTEGTILSWRKAEGDTVAKGDVLGEIETGKVNIEIEAFTAGVLRKILVAAGETVPVGTAIAIIGTADEAIELPAGNAPAPSMNGSTVEGAPAAPAASLVSAAPSSSTAPAATAESTTSTLPTSSSTTPATALDSRLRASPLARRLAKDHNIPLTAVAGTGPSSRITRDDVLAAIEAGVTTAEPPIAPTALPVAPAGTTLAVAPTTTAPLFPGAMPAPAGGEDIGEPLPAMRRTIARRLTESWTSAPHIFLTMPIQMDAALALRKQINTSLEASGVKVSVNDLIVKAAARALRVHPRVNVSWDDGTRIVHTRVNIGVAVALDDGLITLTMPDADLRPLSAIAAEVVDKAARARAGKLQPADLATPSTFTVTNLGMYGIEDFTAIINPPEAAILAIGAAVPTPVVEDGAVVVRTLMRVTLSADHRVVDGAAAAEFLVTLKGLLEQPLGMLV